MASILRENEENLIKRSENTWYIKIQPHVKSNQNKTKIQENVSNFKDFEKNSIKSCSHLKMFGIDFPVLDLFSIFSLNYPSANIIVIQFRHVLKSKLTLFNPPPNPIMIERQFYFDPLQTFKATLTFHVPQIQFATRNKSSSKLTLVKNVTQISCCRCFNHFSISAMKKHSRSNLNSTLYTQVMSQEHFIVRKCCCFFSLSPHTQKPIIAFTDKKHMEKVRSGCVNSKTIFAQSTLPSFFSLQKEKKSNIQKPSCEHCQRRLIIRLKEKYFPFKDISFICRV